MIYQFMLKKHSPNTQDIVQYLKSRIKGVVILKVQNYPKESVIEMAQKTLVTGLKEAIRQMYRSVNFINMLADYQINTPCALRTVLIRTDAAGIRTLSQVEIVNQLQSVRLPYVDKYSEPVGLQEFTLEDDDSSFFSSFKMQALYTQQKLSWTYSGKSIMVSMDFTYNSFSKVTLLLCFQFTNIDIEYFTKEQRIHMKVVPDRQPQFYYSQNPFETYSHPLIRHHHHIDNIFYPSAFNEKVFLRLVVSKTAFQSDEYLAFSSHLKHHDLYTYKRISSLFMSKKMFNYQFHQQKIKKSPSRSLMTSYVLSSLGPQYHLQFENIYNNTLKLVMLVAVYPPNHIPYVESDICKMHVSDRGQVVVEKSIHIVVGATEAGRRKGRLFVLQQKLWNQHNFCFESREGTHLKLMQQLMSLGTIQCQYTKLVSQDILRVANKYQTDKKQVPFLGWIGTQTLRSNNVFVQQAVVYVEVNNVGGYLFCQETPTQDDSEMRIDLSLLDSFGFETSEYKLKFLGIQCQQQHFLTDQQAEQLQTVLSFGQLVNIQKQTYQSLLYHLENYFQTGKIHSRLTLISPLHILRLRSLSSYFKQELIAKFQRIKNHLTLGVTIKAHYGQTKETTSTLNHKFIFVLLKGKLIKLKNTPIVLQNNHTWFVVLPSNFRSIFHDQKFVLITNQFLIDCLISKAQILPGIGQFKKQCNLPYQYSYSQFLREALECTRFKSLFTNELKLRNPFLKGKKQQESTQEQSTPFIDQITKLVEETLQIGRCESYVSLMTDGQNVQELYKLGCHYADRYDTGNEDSQTIQKDLDRIRNVKYREIHELFLSKALKNN